MRTRSLLPPMLTLGIIRSVWLLKAAPSAGAGAAVQVPTQCVLSLTAFDASSRSSQSHRRCLRPFYTVRHAQTVVRHRHPPHVVAGREVPAILDTFRRVPREHTKAQAAAGNQDGRAWDGYEHAYASEEVAPRPPCWPFGHKVRSAASRPAPASRLVRELGAKSSYRRTFPTRPRTPRFGTVDAPSAGRPAFKRLIAAAARVHEARSVPAAARI